MDPDARPGARGGDRAQVVGIDRDYLLQEQAHGRTVKLVAQAEKIVSEYEDIRYVISNIGAMGGDPFSQGGTGTHINRVVLDFKDFHDRSRSSSEIVNEVRQRILAVLRETTQDEGE